MTYIQLNPLPWKSALVLSLTLAVVPVLPAISDTPAIIQETTQLNICISILEQSCRKTTPPCAAGSGHLYRWSILMKQFSASQLQTVWYVSVWQLWICILNPPPQINTKARYCSWKECLGVFQEDITRYFANCPSNSLLL